MLSGWIVVMFVLSPFDAACSAVNPGDSMKFATTLGTQGIRDFPLRPLWSGMDEIPKFTRYDSSTQPPVPQPFPRPASPQPARPRQQPEGAPTEAMLGVPIYPGAQFLASYDAGQGQRYYIFGSAASFVELVTYYRTILKQRGELVFDVPATHEFDVGRYREDTMAFPPGVTIKDYQSDLSQGYPNPRPGGQPARFPTLIQIVPVTEK
jgi:hypothetical protein